MITKDCTARYSMEVRDMHGNRTTLIFDNKDEAYKYCSDMVDDGDSNEYEIMNIIQYDNIDDNAYATMLYSALDHITYTINWEDVMSYLA